MGVCVLNVNITQCVIQLSGLECEAYCYLVRDRALGQPNRPHQWARIDTQVGESIYMDHTQQVHKHTLQQRSLVWPVHLTAPPRRPASQPASERKE